GDAPAELVDRHHAGRLAREQLFDVAAEVTVEMNRSPRRRDREQDRNRPKELAVAEGPGHEATGQGAGDVGKVGLHFERRIGRGSARSMRGTEQMITPRRARSSFAKPRP